MKSQTLAVVAAFTAIAHTAPQYGKRAQQDDCDPFAILDAQNWVNPDNVCIIAAIFTVITNRATPDDLG